MKQLLVLTAIIAVSLPVFAGPPIEKGDKIPEFKAVDEQGNTWKLSDQRADYTVFYFYPAAFTGGCTAQACSYRDMGADFAKLNAQVIGISGDEQENLAAFKEHHNLNFTLLADPDGALAELFGVPSGDGGSISKEVDGKSLTLDRGVTTQRWTFVMDVNGKLIYKNTDVNAGEDSETVLKYISDYQKRRSCTNF